MWSHDRVANVPVPEYRYSIHLCTCIYSMNRCNITSAVSLSTTALHPFASVVNMRRHCSNSVASRWSRSSPKRFWSCSFSSNADRMAKCQVSLGCSISQPQSWRTWTSRSNLRTSALSTERESRESSSVSLHRHVWWQSLEIYSEEHRSKYPVLECW